MLKLNSMIKKITFFLVLSFVAMHTHIAQNNTLRFTQQYLMSHKWYPDIYREESKKSSIITYTSTQMIDSIFKENVNIEFYIRDYYLSDTKDTVFDISKVGKTSSGKYIIEIVKSIKPGIDDLILIFEVVSMSEEKMLLRNLTRGFSSWGYVTTFYTSPLR